MSKGIMIRIFAFIMAVLMVLPLAACGNKAETAEAAVTAVKVNIANPSFGYIEERASFTGMVMPDDSVSVFGKSAGEVLKTYFEIGDMVEEGDLLFELDPEDYLIALEQSRVAYEMTLKNVDIAENGSGDALTELNYQTTINAAQNAYEMARDALEVASDDEMDFAEFKRLRKKLKDAEEAYDDDESEVNWKQYIEALKKYDEEMDDYFDYTKYNSLITQFENAYDNYLTAVKSYDIYKSTQKGENAVTYDLTRQQAKLQYDSMLQTMDNLKVYAPISGVIEEKNVSANDTYAPSMAGYVVSNKDILTVTFSVSRNVVNNISVGDEVVIDDAGDKYTAVITEIGSMVNSANGLFKVEAKLDESANVLSGVSVKLTAVTDKNENGLLVPFSSVYYDNGDAYVYLEKDGVAVAAPVTVGIIADGFAEITKGLTASDNIIITWSPNLDDGVSVEISEEV